MTAPLRAVTLPTYEVTIAAGLLARLGEHCARAVRAHRWVLVTDTTVDRLHGDAARAGLSAAGLAHETVAFPPGEQEKTRERWAWLTDELLARGCGRDTVLVALGGGVVGDLAGFTAATYLRGVPVVQVPTTLLAMVDASVGGKTAVDVPAGKNLVGAFHPPAAVLVDPAVLTTLPAREWRAGMGEVLKHGIIADADYLASTVGRLPALLDPARVGEPPLAECIERSVRIKAEVVAADEREGGRRKVLNFGHTLGHAVELVSGYALLHGEAVAIGMSLEAALAERLGIAEPGTAPAVDAALRATGLPLDPPVPLDPARVIAATRSDKKARAGVVEYALPAIIGRMAGEDRGWGTPVPEGEVVTLLRERWG